MRLETISEGDNIQLISTNGSNTIDITFISKGKAIKEVNGSRSKIDDVNVIDVNSIGSIKISKFAKSKNLIQLKESGMRFFTSGARLALIKLR